VHRSRLQVVLIDSPPEVADEEVAFWSGALGADVTRDAGGTFTTLATWGSGVELVHQRLDGGAARVHLDIETDDTDAEVARLTALGAVVVGGHDTAVHLHDPAGLVFCVVPVQSETFDAEATTWP
jgi:hypothetical protein